jgi:hypothetical protein
MVTCRIASSVRYYHSCYCTLSDLRAIEAPVVRHLILTRVVRQDQLEESGVLCKHVFLAYSLPTSRDYYFKEPSESLSSLSGRANSCSMCAVRPLARASHHVCLRRGSQGTLHFLQSFLNDVSISPFAHRVDGKEVSRVGRAFQGSPRTSLGYLGANSPMHAYHTRK